MLRFVGRKMLHKKWMIASLLIGNLLLCAVAACSPLYSQAVLQKLLTETFSQKLTAQNAYPMRLQMVLSTTGPARGGKSPSEVFAPVDTYVASLPESLGLPAVQEVRLYNINSTRVSPVRRREGEQASQSVRLAALSDMEEHISIVGGEGFSSGVPSDGTLPVLVSESALSSLNLLVGEELSFDHVPLQNGQPLRARVAGVFTYKEKDDPYWVNTVNSYKDTLFIPEQTFRPLFMEPANTNYAVVETWMTLLDYQSFKTGQVSHFLSALDAAKKTCRTSYQTSLGDNFERELLSYQTAANKLNTTIYILQAPLFVLLAAFILMVSGQMLAMEQNEIAVFKSRGAKKRQILSIYLQQSLIIAAFSLALGIPLGMFVCQMLGASNDFLEFVQRKALPVTMTLSALLLSAGAAALSVGTMVLPAFRYADVSIVAHKQSSARKRTPWWQKCGLDLILLAVSLYGYYSFYNRQASLSQEILEGGAMDPLLYFSSSLFMVGAGLLGIRLVPLLCRAVFAIGRRWWSPALYSAFLRITRSRSTQGFIMLFLILTLSMGIFNAQTARSINDNAERRIRYSNGADIVLKEHWSDSSISGYAPTKTDEERQQAMTAPKTYFEPDFGRFKTIPGVESMTQVYRLTDARASVNSGSLKNVTLMGIQTKEFGQTAWFDESLLPAHWYEYLNAISQDARGVLLSSNFRDTYGCQTGDTITYSNFEGSSITGVVYGFVDYWPGFIPYTNMKGTDGIYTEKENFLIVASSAQLKAKWGVFPYEIWFKMEGSSRPVYDFIQEQKLDVLTFSDTQQRLTELKNDPVYQGTNGILTVGFIVVLVLCCTGFLIYWVLSIRARELQFGIFRAMGMSMRELITMLVTEQLLISGSSIALGVLIGKLSSRLFIPLIQIAYTSADQVLPIKILSSSEDFVRLFVIIGGMMLICIGVLAGIISKIKISQALKLGED